MSKLFAANELKQQQEDYQKELDIASLSPFDTSSPYTFMGSIVSKLQTNMLRSGGYNNSIASILSNVVRIPSMALSFNTTANAATGFNVETCGYAKEFDQETGDPATTPAINMAGMPCTGLTPEQDAISMDEAINLLGSNGEGWIDENADIPEGATIEDLVSSGYIKADTPMADFIESCGDASSGNYLFDSAGCVMADGESAADSSKVESELSTKCESIENNTGETESSCYTSSSDHTATSATDSGVKNSKSLSAIVVFLLDYQVSSILSGEDDEEVSSSQSADTSSAGSVVAGDVAWPLNQKLFSSHKHTFLKGHGTSSGTFVRPGGKTGIAADLGANSLGVSLHEPIYSMLDGEVIRVAGGHAVIVRSSVPGGTVDIAYAHGYPQVAVGDVVKAGQQISGIGNNGNSSGAHLHVDMNYNQQQFCPQDLFIFMNDNPGKLPDFKTLVSKASSSGNCARSGS